MKTPLKRSLSLVLVFNLLLDPSLSLCAADLPAAPRAVSSLTCIHEQALATAPLSARTRFHPFKSFSQQLKSALPILLALGIPLWGSPQAPHPAREDRVYQSFEFGEHDGTTAEEYGWKWNPRDAVGLSSPGEPVHEGRHSWKLITTAQWGGTGIKSQTDYWHMNLDPEHNDRLTFWFFIAQVENRESNNAALQLFDHTKHNTDATKVEVWTSNARYQGWTRLTVLFKDLPKDLNLHDIDKIQFLVYWPGTYYIDDIRATGPVTEAKVKGDGTISWKAVKGAGGYELQESIAGPNGPWTTIYVGGDLSFKSTQQSESWLRVRWFTETYRSDWSDIEKYKPSKQASLNGWGWPNVFAIFVLPLLGVVFPRTSRRPASNKTLQAA